MDFLRNERVQRMDVRPQHAAWKLLGGWLAAAALAGAGSLLLFVSSYASASLMGEALAGPNGVTGAFMGSLVLACLAYGVGGGWAHGRVVEVTRPTWRGRGLAATWRRATARGFRGIGLAGGVVFPLRYLGPPWMAPLALGAGFATLGLAQWGVLRRGRGSSLWVPLTLLAWEGGAQVSQGLFLPALTEVQASPALLKPEGLPLLGAYLLVAALTASLLTGLGMTWPSRQPLPATLGQLLPTDPQ